VPNATYTNSIGATELITVWNDPDFDPTLRAFYYLRVLEIPTPRWTAYDAKYFHLKLPAEVPMTTQERAYTSPIWYTPRASDRSARAGAAPSMRSDAVGQFRRGDVAARQRSNPPETPTRARSVTSVGCCGTPLACRSGERIQMRCCA
jgi:hypothetical protein